MDMILLQNNVTNGLMALIDRVGKAAPGELVQSQMSTTQEYGFAVAAIGFFASWAIGASKMIMGQGMNYGFIIKLVAMAAILGSYTLIAPALFNALDGPSSANMQKLTAQLTDSKQAMDDDTKNSQEVVNADMDKNAQAASTTTVNTSTTATTNANDNTSIWDIFKGGYFQKLMIRIFTAILTYVVDIFSFLVDVVFLIVSKYILQILFLLGPIAIGLSFFQPFETSGITWLKSVIAVSLWIFILTTFDLIVNYKEAGLDASITDTTTTVAAAATSAMSLTSLKIGLCIAKLFVPKIADMVVSGSVAGGLYSSAVGAATSVGRAALGGI